MRASGDYVLYWMTSARRTRFSFGLDRALELCRQLGRPLLVFEPLRVGYPWASDRLHSFVMDGMRDNRAACRQADVGYLPYLEPKAGAGKRLLAALAERACAVVGDDYPAFFLPRMLEAARRAVDVHFEIVDGNGLYPMRATERVFTTAASFRRFLQKQLPDHLPERPVANPLHDAPGGAGDVEAAVADVVQRWPMATDDILESGGARDAFLASLPIDHSVGVARDVPGGAAAGTALVDHFVGQRLAGYGDDRNHPDRGGGSGLSPYLHFGHVGAHQVFDAVVDSEDWNPGQLAPKATGSREGWWGMSPAAESFLDELVTWREIGFNMAAQRDDYDQYESLPDWARTTMETHLADDREYIYTLEQFERAQTHDDLWNAAQTELVETGRMHNYLRMLWGKKIYEWTEHPCDALAVMIELNNKYALDGRDPNSYSGIFWVLGRYDRAWGPERPIFGKIRYMTSQSTAKKLKLKDYLERFGGRQKELFA